MYAKDAGSLAWFSLKLIEYEYTQDIDVAVANKGGQEIHKW